MLIIGASNWPVPFRKAAAMEHITINALSFGFAEVERWQTRLPEMAKPLICLPGFHSWRPGDSLVHEACVCFCLQCSMVGGRVASLDWPRLWLLVPTEDANYRAY